jgi:hypothetical protein
MFAVGHAGARFCATAGPGGVPVLCAPAGVSLSASGAASDALPPHDGRVEAVAVRIVGFSIL